MRTAATLSLFTIALLGASACGADIDLPGGAGTTGSGAGSATSGAGAGASTGSAVTSTGSIGAGAGSGSTGSTGTGATGSGSTGSTGAGSGATGSTGAGAGSGSSSTSTGSSGGTPPSKVCGDCAQLAIEGPCQGEFDACNDSFACANLLDCHSKCEWTDACNADCDAIIPSGVAKLTDLMSCVACEQCVLPCIGSTLGIYCP